MRARLAIHFVLLTGCLLGMIRCVKGDEVGDRTASMQQLKQLMLAMHNFHSTEARFPAPAVLSKDKKPLLSWRVAILPYLEDPACLKLYEQFHLDEPWDSAHNKNLVDKMPDVFKCPASKVADKGKTVYVVPHGEDTGFAGPTGTRIRDITDGTSATIAMLEVDDDHAAVWTKPDDLDIDKQKPGRHLGGHFQGVFLAGFFDGSVHAIPTRVDPMALYKFMTCAGREVASINDLTAAAADYPADIASAKQTTLNNVKQLMIAMHNHHATYKKFPPPAILSKENKPLLSWRVKILPFIEQQELYQQFHLDEPWDSEHNKSLIEKMPDVFGCPNSKVAGKGKAVFLLPRGPNTAFPDDEPVSLRKITDGTSNTIGLVEVDELRAVEWTKPEDWTPDKENPTAGLGGHIPGMFVVGFLDGSAFLVESTFDRSTLKALLSRDGGEQIATPSE